MTNMHPSLNAAMTDDVRRLIDAWGIPSAEISPDLIAYANVVANSKPGSRVGDMVVGFQLASRAEVESHAAQKPSNVLLLEYLAEKIDNLRLHTQKLLAANDHLPYFESIPATSVHPSLHGGQGDTALRRLCNELNCVPLISTRPGTIRLVFQDYSVLKEYSERPRLTRMYDAIGRLTDPDSGTPLQVSFGIATRDQIAACLYAEHSDAANAAEQDDQLNVWLAADADTDNQRLLARIIAAAVEKKASNIKFTPLHNGTVHLYYRRHGNLRQIPNIRPLSPQQAEEIARFLHTKSLARYTSTHKRVEGRLLHPADGQFVFRTSTSETFLRCSFIPVANNSLSNTQESISLRLLPRDALVIRLDSLNIAESVINELRLNLVQKHGLILVVGPTSSGKSTTIAGMVTLYRDIYGTTRNLLSLEQPVERELDGITQFQVAQNQFEAGMAALLRHDPNFIWVGEIRDRPSAATSVRAANTGQIVCSTLHADDATLAPSALIAYITNTMAMTAESVIVTPYDAINALLLIVAQRLVPELCPACRIPLMHNQDVYSENLQMYEEYCKRNGYAPIDIRSTFIRNPEGCEVCEHEGYNGERPINELLPVTKPLKQRLLAQLSAGSNDIDLLAQARTATLHNDAMRHVLAGHVSILDALI